MKITGITPCKKQTGRYNIEIDGQFAFAVFYDILADFSLSEGVTLTEKAKEKILYEDAFLKAKKKAFDILSRSDKTEKELADKLCEKGFEPSVAERTASYFKERGYIDDRKYAENKINYLFETKKFGKKRIFEQLYHAGIDKDTIRELLDEYYEDGGKDRIFDVYLKLSSGKNMNDINQKKKVYGALLRRGFDHDEIRNVMKSENEDEF